VRRLDAAGVEARARGENAGFDPFTGGRNCQKAFIVPTRRTQPSCRQTKRERSHPGLISCALADDKSNIVVLFVRTEPLDLLDYRRYHRLGSQLSVRFQRFDQALFAEFFTYLVE
jgi:hypothetical protein